MKIINHGNGIHQREVPGIKYLGSHLPPKWIGHTNLDLSLPQGPREIDLVLFSTDRIFLIDLKDGHGRYESFEGAWSLNGVPQNGLSPVKKVLDNARQVRIQLDRFLEDRARQTGHTRMPTPKVEGVVILTSSPDLSGIAPTEKLSVFTSKSFVEIVSDTKRRLGRFQAVGPDFVTNPIYSSHWHSHLNLFLNARSGVFRPGTRIYGGYVASGNGAATFVGPSKIYQEFTVHDNTAAQSTGLLRKWDFSLAETKFQTQDGRLEVAGRERGIIGWLNDRSELCANAVLQPKAEDDERSVDYWEVYDQRRRMKRFSEFVQSELPRLRPDERIEIARQIIYQVSCLHTYHAAHLNLGVHSIWIALPSEVKLSHLMCARYPQAMSLGNTRYQFLSSVQSPEDELGEVVSGEQRDVYHLGCLVHLVLFGVLPADNPPDWDPGIDTTGTFHNLHHVLEHAISWDCSDRYKDANQLLDAFNAAVEPVEVGAEVLKRLESFKTIPSQMKLFKQYPEHKELKDTDFMTMWTSETDDGLVLVKLWKRAAWSEGTTDLPRILDFLERAHHYSITHPPGCVPIKAAYWLNDAFALVQPYVDAPTLADHPLLADKVAVTPDQALHFSLELVRTVITLHDAGLGHGDLKPENILTCGDLPEPYLVDYLDFCCISDGEIQTTAYAPVAGGTLERDRYAVTMIAQEILHGVKLAEKTQKSIDESITTCRGEVHANATLLPLQDALRRALDPSPQHKIRHLHIGLPNAPTGQLVPDDDGFGYGVTGSELFIRGTSDVLYFRLQKGQIKFARLSQTPQIVHRRLQANQRGILNAEIFVQGDVAQSWKDFQKLFGEPEFIDLVAPSGKAQASIEDSAELEGDDIDPDEEAHATTAETDEDAVAELVEAARTTQRSSIPELWRSLVDVEVSLTNEAKAIGPSTFRKDNGTHAVPIQLVCGTFEFDRRDRVTVERLGNDGRWRRVGILELVKSSAEFIHIEATAWFSSVGNLIEQETRLRFVSRMEYANITRRDAAVKRILARRSIVPNLIDYFDPACSPELQIMPIEVDKAQIKRLYELNDTQAEAFAQIFKVRPLGLLQGPPGTGKTKFIGALIHYALTHGYVRNVLLSSQSHEAVNNAAGAVLKLFPNTEQAPSILRIGQEDDVSEQLLPYHVLRVEQSYKANFNATLKPRLMTAAAAIGISPNVAEKLIWVESSMRPVMVGLNKLAEDPDADGVQDRLQSQLNTLASLVSDMDLDIDIPMRDHLPDEHFLDTVFDEIGHESGCAPDSIAKLIDVSRLTRDMVSSVSTAERSFETFLAGTRQIVVGTCVGLGRSSLGLTSTAFDLVVIDEAARCTASELAVPMQAGRWCVLVGDQNQLEPRVDETVVSLVAEKTGYSAEDIVESAFQTVFESELGKQISQRLDTQYRSLPPIGRVVSSAFYNSRLEPGRLTSPVPGSAFPPGLQHPLMWIYTDEMGEEAFQRPELKKASKSLINRVEVDLIAGMLLKWDKCPKFIEWLENREEQEPAIGIICSYSAQATAIRHKLRLARLSDTMQASVKVGTVDSYQGKENRIILLSLVRNNIEGRRVDGKPTIRPGFMARPNRINVAASRAMDRLVIVGAKDRWAPGGPMATLKEKFEQEVTGGQGIFIEATEMLVEQREALMASVSTPCPKKAANKELS